MAPGENKPGGRRIPFGPPRPLRKKTPVGRTTRLKRTDSDDPAKVATRAHRDIKNNIRRSLFHEESRARIHQSDSGDLFRFPSPAFYRFQLTLIRLTRSKPRVNLARVSVFERRASMGKIAAVCN